MTDIRPLLADVAAARPDLAHEDGRPNLTRIGRELGTTARVIRRWANQPELRPAPRVVVVALRGLASGRG